jgi:hypothetical protein
MASNLQVSLQLPKGWYNHSSQNPKEPLLYRRHLSKYAGALQISLAEYVPGKIPDLNATTLINIAKQSSSDLGEVIEEASGDCVLGAFGTVVRKSNRVARAQAWSLTDGHVIVFVTHICERSPDPTEVDEVQNIVRGLRVVDSSIIQKHRPWWKFWGSK